MKRQSTNIRIGELGVLDLSIPIVRFGSGKPEVLIICGMHGDEASGLILVKKLLENLNLKKGTLSIIPAANPLAQALERRENPEDLKDLNRSFPGNERGRGTSTRLAKAISAEAEKNDLIIDLHAFSNRCPTTAVFINHGPRKSIRRSKELIKAFGPELVWKLDLKDKEEVKLSGSLLPILAEQGKLVFGVELPRQHLITDSEIREGVCGLENVLAEMGMVDGKPRTREEIPIFERQQVLTDKAGLFLAGKNLMERVAEGEKVGTLTSLKSLKTENIVSPFAGILTSIANNRLINTGDKIFTVGKIVEAP